jgi:hypothetical protein
MSKRKAAPRRRPGREIKHGAYSIVYREEIVKRYPELVRYTQDCHAALLKDLAPGGPDTLSAAKGILLDRLTSKLLTAGLLDIYLGQQGIIRRDRLDQRVLECEPAVATYLQVNNAIRHDLVVLGLERVNLEPHVLTPDELMAQVELEDQDSGKEGTDDGQK